jgi:hypothetical protein
MWYLEAFNNATEDRTEIHLLENMTVDIVKKLLGIDDNDFDLPIAVRSNDDPLDLVREFAPYTRTPIKADSDCEYWVSFLAEWPIGSRRANSPSLASKSTKHCIKSRAHLKPGSI